MDWQQSGKERRERSRASIYDPMKRRASSAFRGGPCRPGSPPASSAFAVLVARYFSPLRTFKQRLTATASRPLASRNRAVSQSRPARSSRRAVSRQRANTGCNASHLSRPRRSRPTRRPRISANTGPLAAGSPESLNSHVLLHSRPPEARSHCRCKKLTSPSKSSTNGIWAYSGCPSLGNNWQIHRNLMPFVAIWCKADEVNFTQAGVEKHHFYWKARSL